MPRIALDGRKGDIYLITQDNNPNPNGVIIWAHGVSNNRTFTPNNQSVQFLCPDNYALQSTFYQHVENNQILHLSDMTRGVMGVDMGSLCDDYSLTKAINYHHTGHWGKNFGTQFVQGKVATGEAEGLGMATYNMLEEFVESGRSNLDIISIRNRWQSHGSTLSQVIAALDNANYDYHTVYCHFCRVPQGVTANNAQAWDINNSL